MTDRVYYLGRTEDPPGTWTVRFAQGRAGVHSATYWTSFRTKNLFDSVDVDAPNFWGAVVYEGGKLVENRKYREDGSLSFLVDDVAQLARTTAVPLVEPPVGAVCWRFGSPPYDPEDD
jgi:hypothetical protein